MNSIDQAKNLALCDSVSILIVDDNPNNLRVLNSILVQAGYKVRPALSGEIALRSIESRVPDLVLLDIRMPDMDGYEVCRRLKANAKTQDIPIIFISALQEAKDKVGAFHAGAVDYIIKPFQLEEVLARVKAHSELSTARKALQAAYAEMESRVEERTRELQASKQRIERSAQIEQTLGELLRLSLQPTTLHRYLQIALEAITRPATGLNFQEKSAIFLVEEVDEKSVLHLAASQKFSDEHLDACKTMPLGQCICGHTAEQGKLQLCHSRDDLDEIGVDNTNPHGHYSVPIVANQTLLGVMIYYLKPDHKQCSEEESILSRTADVISMGITRRYAEAKIEHLAYHDELTDIANRRLFTDRLIQVLRSSKRRGYITAVLFLDFDQFKTINDALGHLVGDEFLKISSRRLTALLRDEDTVARWGGDEFAILLPNVSRDPERAAVDVQNIATKLQQQAALPAQIENNDLQLNCSIGISLFTNENAAWQELIREADTAMYQAKQNGRNQICFYRAEMQAAAERRLTLDKDMRHGLEREEFVLFYQPLVNNGGDVVGAEALIRWNHPTKGMISPDEFIPLAEESKLIIPIGNWVMKTALRQMQEWLTRPQCPATFKKICINVSSVQFTESDFNNHVNRYLADAKIDPTSVELEVTESTLLIDIEDAVEKMKQLKDAGIRFSIDDFGTGYSSLAYLKRLPLNTLKIDRSFVSQVESDEQNAAIVRTIFAMSEAMEFEVIAEGVETIEEYHFLKALHCTTYQGYYFNRPLAVEVFQDFLWDN